MILKTLTMDGALPHRTLSSTMTLVGIGSMAVIYYTVDSQLAVNR